MNKLAIPLAVSLLFSSNLYAHGADEEFDQVEPAQQTSAADTQELTEQQQFQAWATDIWENLNRINGEVALPNGVASLNVPDTFYYLSPDDAQVVLEQVWGNPPGQVTLGMLMPAEYTPFDAESWAVTIEYEESGYVSDEEADEIDYTELLAQMKQDTELASQARVEQGYEAISLVGWASPPYYDKDANKLHWAKEIAFASSPQHTLNYNIRVLGRKGVLVLNFIASMEQKPMIESNLDAVLAIAEFDQGQRYSDFDPDIDEVAAYGLGALIAGKAVAKTGFIAAAIMFLKKFGVFIVIGIGALIKKIFSRKKQES